MLALAWRLKSNTFSLSLFGFGDTRGAAETAALADVEGVGSSEGAADGVPPLPKLRPRTKSIGRAAAAPGSAPVKLGARKTALPGKGVKMSVLLDER